MIWDTFNLCLRTLFPKTAVLLRNVNILATEHGQWNSINRNQSVDRLGRPLPWYTYPAIQYLDALDVSGCDVFEFGSGNSSLYWAGRARTVTSVEDNPLWHKHVLAGAMVNQTLLLRTERDAYVAAIANGGMRYDIVVIDGNHRVECTKAAMDHLDPGGMIVLDNSDRETERPCSSILRDAGFIQIDFCGFGPINGYCWSTSVFFRRTFSLPRNHLGPRPVGGLES